MARWVLDDGIGTTAVDSAGHGHTGRLYGSASWTSAAMVGPYALSFRSSGQGHVVVPDSPDLEFAATQSFSLTAWVYVPSVPDRWVGIIEKSRDAGNWYGIWINHSNRWVSGAGVFANLEGPAVAIGWSHVAVVQNGLAGTRVINVNGVEVASGTAAPSDGTGDLWIGGAAGCDEYFDGVVDEVRLYNRALAAAEVQTLAGDAPRLVAGKSPAPDSAVVPTPTVTRKDIGGPKIQEQQNQQIALNDEPRPEEILAAHGLRLVRSQYLMGSETNVSKAVSETDRLERELRKSQMHQHMMVTADAYQYQNFINFLDAQIRDWKLEIEAINRRMTQLQRFSGPAIDEERLTFLARRNELENALPQEIDNLNQLKREPFDRQSRRQVAEQVANNQAAYDRALEKLVELVDQTTREYAELDADDEIRRALDKLEKNAGVTLTLGPSRDFQRLRTSLDKSQKNKGGRK